MNAMDLGRVLLRPRSVAVVGAADDPSRPSGRPLALLEQSGFDGAVYPVNPNRRTVQGRPSWRALSELPEVPDHALVLTGTEAVQPIVEEAAALGVPLVTVLADGFGEAGPEGEARAHRLRAALEGSSTRLIGPSSLGVVSRSGRAALTASPAFRDSTLAAGPTFVASQSGSIMGALASRAAARGIGLAALVSVGGELDLGVGELCAATLTDPGIDSYILFLESTRHGDRLEAFARRAAQLGRPVVAYLLGRTAQAAALARTHTGALSGDYDVAAAFLTDIGIAVVEDFSSLLDAVTLARAVPSRRTRAGVRVGIVSTTGGGAATLVDQLGRRGVGVTSPSCGLFGELHDGGAPGVPAPVVDLTLAGTRPDVVRHAVGTMAASCEFDLLVAVIGSSAATAPELAVHPVAEVGVGSRTPVAALLMPHAPGAFDHLHRAGIPTFTSPEACADAIAALWRRRAPGMEARPRPPAAGPGDGRVLHEAAAFGLLDELGIPRVPAVELDVPVRGPIELPFPYPVAVKILSDQVPHKTDVGGVVLDVRDADQLVAAAEQVVANVAAHRPEVGPSRVVVEPMTDGVAELLVGYRVDPGAGPVVLVAFGGELAEVVRDRSLRLAPVGPDEARAMVEELGASALLRGFRGRPVADVDAVADAIARFSLLAGRAEVLEAEMNPLVVGAAGSGVTAVDALVLVREG